MPTALITGITGQDGSYLAEFLLSKGYTIIGMSRRTSTLNFERIEEYKPDEVYNLAAQSFVPASWPQAVLTAEVTAVGVLRILDAIRQVNPKIMFYQASSSEMFGKVVEVPQQESTPFYPRSPYGVAKVYGHWITVNYRESYNLFTVSGILFNHESPRRGFEFVTRKISRGAAAIKLGLTNKLCLGNLDAQRDWGYALDYVRAMWMMLQQETPSDFVIGSGETHSVREFCEIAFGCLDMDYRVYVTQDPKFYRPAEVDLLISNPTKAHKVLGWAPSITFRELVEMMVQSDIEQLSGVNKEVIKSKI